MSIQELASLAELVGVLGVLASLIYVALQLRQSTVQLRVAASSDRLQTFLQFWFRLADDPEFVKLWLRGDSEFATMDEVEQFRVVAFETAGLTVWSYFFDLHREGLLPDERWNEHLHDIGGLGQREAMRAAWSMNKARYSLPYQQLMSSHIELAG